MSNAYCLSRVCRPFQILWFVFCCARIFSWLFCDLLGDSDALWVIGRARHCFPMFSISFCGLLEPWSFLAFSKLIYSMSVILFLNCSWISLGIKCATCVDLWTYFILWDRFYLSNLFKRLVWLPLWQFFPCERNDLSGVFSSINVLNKMTPSPPQKNFRFIKKRKRKQLMQSFSLL